MCSKSSFNVDDGLYWTDFLVLYWYDNCTLPPACLSSPLGYSLWIKRPWAVLQFSESCWFFFCWNMMILTSTHPTVENQHIWPLTSKIQWFLPVVYTNSSFRYNWCANFNNFMNLVVQVDEMMPWRLGTIFYLSYLAFEFPQNLCLQHFPVGKWMRYV